MNSSVIPKNTNIQIKRKVRRSVGSMKSIWRKPPISRICRTSI